MTVFTEQRLFADSDLEEVMHEQTARLRSHAQTLSALCVHLGVLELTEAEVIEVCDALEDVVSRMADAFDAVARIADAR